MSHNTRLLFALVFSTVFLVFGCSKKADTFATADYYEYDADDWAGTGYNPDGVEQAEAAVYSDMANAVGGTQAKRVVSAAISPEAPVATADDSAVVERKLVKTGDLTVQVANLADAEATANKWCGSFGGYVSNSNSYETYTSVTYRIPSEHFDSAISEFSGTGKLKQKTISARDVTDSWYDLDTRIKTKIILQERLQNYLKDAKDMKDLLAIERELNSVQSDLESMQGQFKRLNNQVEFSTITVTFRLAPNTTPQGFRWPNLGEKLRDFAATALNFFANLLVFLIGLVVFGIPIVLVVALLFWLCFGKIGLVRKLFARLKK